MLALAATNLGHPVSAPTPTRHRLPHLHWHRYLRFRRASHSSHSPPYIHHIMELHPLNKFLSLSTHHKCLCILHPHHRHSNNNNNPCHTMMFLSCHPPPVAPAGAIDGIDPSQKVSSPFSTYRRDVSLTRNAEGDAAPSPSFTVTQDQISQLPPAERDAILALVSLPYKDR
jgi:hypothetical protein